MQIGWNGRGTLKSLMGELERQRANSFDFAIDTRNLAVAVRKPSDGNAFVPYLIRSMDADANVREWVPSDGLRISDSAIAQLGERVNPGIPTKFLRRLIEERPDRAESLLTGLLWDTASVNLVRVLDGGVRAFLSDRYQPFDHHSLAFAALDAAKSVGAVVLECGISETNMRIKLTTTAVRDSIDEGRAKGEGGGHAWYRSESYANRIGVDAKAFPGGPGVVHPAVTISNSETGHGSLYVKVGLLRAYCINLAIIEDVVSNIHLGSKLEPGVFSRETIAKDAEVVMAKAGDAIRTAFNEDRFKALTDLCRAAQDTEVKPTKAVDFAIGAGVFTQAERDMLLEHFMQSGFDSTAYGFAQTCARAAQDMDSPDRAVEIEEFAGKVIANPALVG